MNISGGMNEFQDVRHASDSLFAKTRVTLSNASLSLVTVRILRFEPLFPALLESLPCAIQKSFATISTHNWPSWFQISLRHQISELSGLQRGER